MLVGIDPKNSGGGGHEKEADPIVLAAEAAATIADELSPGAATDVADMDGITLALSTDDDRAADEGIVQCRTRKRTTRMMMKSRMTRHEDDGGDVVRMTTTRSEDVYG